MRIEARVRLGYYPLPLAEAERIRQHLQLTPGFVALDPCIGEGHAGTEEEIRHYMSGNLCRCGAYPNIVKAVQQARARIERS